MVAKNPAKIMAFGAKSCTISIAIEAFNTSRIATAIPAFAPKVLPALVPPKLPEPCSRISTL